MQSTIRSLSRADVAGVVALSLAAWVPVFASLEAELGPEVFRMLYQDWRSAQARDVEAVCTAPDSDVWVAVIDGRPVGFVAVCYVEEGGARAGEISMIAVDPGYQGAGLGASLMQRAVAEIEAQGVGLAVIATGGDPGHAPARGLYEKCDFNPLHQVRYYRKL